MDSPLVSILVLTYNQQNYIEETLESISYQTYKNLQIVISDDCSTDLTQKIIQEYQQKHPNIIITHFNKENIGITKNFSQALLSCTGKYIALLDGDDLFYPSKIEKQVEILEDSSDMALTYHDIKVFNSDIDESLYYWKDRYNCRNVEVDDLIRYGPFIPYSSIMFRRDCVSKPALFEQINVGSDWLFIIEILISCNGYAGWHDEVLANYRRHSNNVTNTWGWKFHDQLKTLQLVDQYWPEHKKSIKRRKSEVYLIRSVRQFSKGDYKGFLDTLWKAYTLSFPWFISFFRLITREILFIITHKGKVDDLLVSLFRK